MAVYKRRRFFRRLPVFVALGFSVRRAFAPAVRLLGRLPVFIPRRLPVWLCALLCVLRRAFRQFAQGQGNGFILNFCHLPDNACAAVCKIRLLLFCFLSAAAEQRSWAKQPAKHKARCFLHDFYLFFHCLFPAFCQFFGKLCFLLLSYSIPAKLKLS